MKAIAPRSLALTCPGRPIARTAGPAFRGRSTIFLRSLLSTLAMTVEILKPKKWVTCTKLSTLVLLPFDKEVLSGTLMLKALLL